jgi:hypothetical protein
MFPKADQVTYYYFRARICLNQGEFPAALSYSNEGYKACPRRFVAQKRRITIYLIVAKMIQGFLPSEQLLKSLSLEAEFSDLKRSIKNGDLNLFERSLLSNQKFFIKSEVFLIIQLRLKNLIMRSFFKNVYVKGLLRGP